MSDKHILVETILESSPASDDHVSNLMVSNEGERRRNRVEDANRPLLNRSSAGEGSQSSTAEAPLSMQTALKIIFTNTLPMVILNFITFSIKNLSLHLVKDRNNDDLTNAVGVGNSLLNVVAIALFMSLNTGLTSGSAQAFGAKNYQLMGHYLHKGFLINAITLIPGCCVLYWSNEIALLLGFDSQTAIYTQQYSALCIIGVIALMIYNTLTGYLNACDIFWAPSIIQIVSAVVFWALSILLADFTDMDIIVVVALSYNIMQVLAAVLMFAYIKIKNPVPGSFFWFRADSFKGLWKFFKYEFFVGSMIFIEWIYYQIIYLASGRLSTVDVSALTIAAANFEMWYAIPLSLCDTVMAFVGNSVGEGSIAKSQIFLKAGLFWSTVSFIIVEIFYAFFSKTAAEFYVTDSDTIDVAVNLFRIYMIYYPFDFTQMILSSGIRALGIEKLGTLIFVVCYYVLALPATYLLCFVADKGIYGLLTGPLVGLGSLFVCVVVVFWRLNWKKQIESVQKRMEDDEKSEIE